MKSTPSDILARVMPDLSDRLEHIRASLLDHMVDMLTPEQREQLITREVDKLTPREQAELIARIAATFTPDPVDHAAVDSFWSRYWALNDVATGLFMLAEVFRIRGQCQKARAIYEQVIEAYPCAFAWDPRNGGFCWNVAEVAQNRLSETCPHGVPESPKPSVWAEGLG